MALTFPMITEAQLLNRLKDFVARHGNQKKAADALRVTPQYLSDILRGNRMISGVIVKGLGFKEVRMFEQLEPSPNE